MATTWIVAADESRARVLQVTDPEPRFSGHGGLGKPGAAPTSGPPSDAQRQGKLVADELPKDLSWLNAREIEEYFAKEKKA